MGNKITLSTAWYEGQNQEDFKKLVIQSSVVLAQLRKICYNRIREYKISQALQPDYKDSAWAYKQADSNGYIRALSDMAELLNVIDNDK